MSYRGYKKQYLWVSQDFYNWIMGSAQRLKKKGNQTGSADLTHKLIHDIKLPERVSFDRVFIQGRWTRRRKVR